jgi:hypothetical protein
MDFAAESVPIGHTGVTLRHHTAVAESLAIIEDSRSITFRSNDIAHEVHYPIFAFGGRGMRR